MDETLIWDVTNKSVLHWNCRGFIDLPNELTARGRQVQEIYLKWNNLTQLPIWLGALQSLTNLYLQYNKLEHLPDAVGDLTSLSVLDVSQNLLTCLPSTLSRLKNLQVLVAANNRITTLPNELRRLQSLEELDISNNKIYELNDCICDCEALQELKLDNNYLTTLPPKIVYLPNLVGVSVCGNQLQYLPMLPFVSAPDLTFHDNPGLNYISVSLGCQIAFGSCGRLWDLRASGSFARKETANNVCPPKALVPTGQFFGMTVEQLALPKCLHRVYPAEPARTIVPSLYEMSLKMVYSFCFTHGIYNSIENGRNRIRMSRTLCNQKALLVLPQNIKHQLLTGPAALCYLCQCPIFNTGVLWVIPKQSFGESRNESCYILCTVLFCSIKCNLDYEQWETSTGLFSELLINHRLKGIQILSTL